jgi:poly-gamma-glutamate synthesis protein (capsule biosynthesis protein)
MKKRNIHRGNPGYQLALTVLLVLAMGFSVFNIRTVQAQQEAKAQEVVEVQPTEPVVEEPEPEVSLVMVGDILLHDAIENKFLVEDGTYNFAPLFANVKDEISQADLALVNQEVIIGGTDLGITGYPNFNAPYEVADYLVDTGFDVVLHATNHALDRGARGINNCLDNWQQKYPEETILGIHDSQESQDNIYVYEQDGMKIAILNYTYGTNGIPLPSSMPYAVDLLEEDRVVNDIARAKEMSDFVVVCPHWGTEYNLGTDKMQEKWTDIFLQNGVDLVIGTHPHVIEPIEMVEDEATGHKMLVYYSLGNFCSWTSSDGEGVANRSIGGLAQVTLRRDDEGNVVIADYGIQPIICHLSHAEQGVAVYNIQDYTDVMANGSIIKEKDSNFSLQYATDLCDEVWGDLWRQNQ